MHQDLSNGEVIQCDEPGAPNADDVLFTITAKCRNDQAKTSHEGERYVKMPKNLSLISPKRSLKLWKLSVTLVNTQLLSDN